MLGFSKSLRVIVVGANSGIASELIQTLVEHEEVSEIWISTRNSSTINHNKIRHSYVDIEDEQQIADCA